MKKANITALKKYIRKRNKKRFHGAAFGVQMPDGKSEIIDHMVEDDGIWLSFWPDVAMISFNDQYKNIISSSNVSEEDVDVVMFTASSSDEVRRHFSRLYHDWCLGSWKPMEFAFTDMGNGCVSVEPKYR